MSLKASNRSVAWLVGLILLSSVPNASSVENAKEVYMEQRQELMEKGEQMAFDAGTVLTQEEERLDTWLAERTTDYIVKTRKDHTFEPAR